MCGVWQAPGHVAHADGARAEGGRTFEGTGVETVGGTTPDTRTGAKQ